jgi:uncharacterized membrane protein YozB (DUF420 family)
VDTPSKELTTPRSSYITSDLARIRGQSLYVVLALAVALVVFAGFSRTYFFREWFGLPGLSKLLKIHGAIMSGWILLFVAQASLISRRRIRLHQRLGTLGAVLAILVVLVGSFVAIRAAQRSGLSNETSVARSDVSTLALLAFDIFTLALFAGFVGLALLARRRSDVHKRFMLLACLVVLPFAIVRLPLHFIQSAGPIGSIGIFALFMLPFLLADSVRHRQVHPVLLLGTTVVVLFQFLSLLVGPTHAWLRIAQWLLRI